MIPWFQWTTISLGPVVLQVWGMMVAAGLLVASVIISRTAKKRGYDPTLFYDLILWMVVSGVVFSRLFHVVFYDIGFYLANPIDVVKIWHGGLSSFGGIFGAGVGMFFFWKKRRLERKNLLPTLDILSFGAVYGWLLGRLGCFFIHDHLGKGCSCPTCLSCSLAIDTPEGPRYDMALLEILGLLPLAIIFVVFRKRDFPVGSFLAVLFIYYGVLRFFLDFWRIDTKYFGLTPAQYFAMVLVALGGWLVFLRKKK